MITRNNDQFNVFPAQIGMREYILYFNIVFPEKDTFVPQYTLMPNACGTLSVAFDGSAVAAELWGAALTPVLLGTEPNRYRILLLIQLSPFGLYQITGQNQAEFADKRLSLAAVDRELYNGLFEAFAASETAGDLVNACARILRRRMERQIVSDALLSAVTGISSQRGQVQVSQVARQCGYSERQLHRLFLTQIGTNVKNYARLIRFNYVLKRLQKAPGCFAALSQQAGYYDQAHFDKDFKAISGVSPQTYLQTMTDFYYDGTEIYHTMSSKEDRI